MFTKGSLLVAAGLYLVILVAVCLQQGPRTYFAVKPAALESEADQESAEPFQTALSVFAQDWTAKERITEQVIDGRLSLLEGAAHFRAVYARRPANPYCVPKPQLFPGASEGERLCRQVIQWVRMRLADHPSRDQVLSRLARELEETLALRGSVLLPELLPEI